MVEVAGRRHAYQCDLLLWERKWSRAQKSVDLQQETKEAGLTVSGSSLPKKTPESSR